MGEATRRRKLSIPKMERKDNVIYELYVVRKTYPDGIVTYFESENEFMFVWALDKKRAHVFSSKRDALLFAKRTEEEHAQRIADGKAAATNVAVEQII